MNCPKCGAEYSEGAKFCSKCGESLAALTPEPVPVAAKPVADAAVVSDAPKEAIASAQAGAADAPKGNNTVIIVLIVALVVIIGAAGTSWYLWNKDKSASGVPISNAPTSAPQGTPGQPGAASQQPGMPQVDEYGMPAKQPGVVGQQPEPASAPGQQPVAPVQSGADLPQSPASAQPGANVPQQEVMPEPMPQEVRKRPAENENPSPRRNVKMAGSIDEQYRQRAASECPQGASGLFCREKVRYQLCNKRWSASPPPGQSVCQKLN